MGGRGCLPADQTLVETDRCSDIWICMRKRRGIPIPRDEDCKMCWPGLNDSMRLSFCAAATSDSVAAELAWYRICDDVVRCSGVPQSEWVCSVRWAFRDVSSTPTRPSWFKAWSWQAKQLILPTDIITSRQAFRMTNSRRSNTFLEMGCCKSFVSLHAGLRESSHASLNGLFSNHIHAWHTSMQIMSHENLF